MLFAAPVWKQQRDWLLLLGEKRLGKTDSLGKVDRARGLSTELLFPSAAHKEPALIEVTSSERWILQWVLTGRNMQ